MKKIFTLLVISVLVLSSCTKQKKNEQFHFYVATDVHMTKSSEKYTNWCFRDKILQDIKKDSMGTGKFIVVTGDLDPFKNVRQSVEQVMGKNYRFYPVLGNHDVGYTNNKFEKYPDANWGNTFDIVKYNKSTLKNIVNWGPVYRTPALDSLTYTDSLGNTYLTTYDSLDIIGSKYTTYSFDQDNSHFVVLDIYSGLESFEEKHSGRVFKELYDWLEKDLSETEKENIFVFAHQPVWETMGEDTMSLVNNDYKAHCIRNARTMGADSTVWFKKNYTDRVVSRKKFWNLMKEHNVIAYFCGHIHHYSAKKIDGVWEINMEYGGWENPDHTRYGRVIVDDKKVNLDVMVFKNDPDRFELTEEIKLK